MRGADRQQAHLFSYVSPERRVPPDHPLRAIRVMVDAALQRLSPAFEALYADTGRPSVAPEKLLRALLLQAFYSVRSEALLMEQLTYNLLFRWFVGLNMDEPVWDATTFTKNRDRLLDGDIAQEFFTAIQEQARAQGLLSDEHFTVDGTLLEAWASQKSFQRKDHPTPPSDDDPGNPTVDFHGERRSNATHESTTDPEARLCRKGKGREAKLAYLGNLVMDNREGRSPALFIVAGTVHLPQAPFFRILLVSLASELTSFSLISADLGELGFLRFPSWTSPVRPRSPALPESPCATRACFFLRN